MKFSIRFADQIVGTLVILALAILVIVVFMIGRNQRWFVRDVQYRTYFHSASGLSTNMSLQYKGFTIGHVKKIELADDDRVEVIFTVFEEYAARVKEGSVVEIQAAPIPGLGNSFIFYPGLGRELIPEGDVIPEINSDAARYYISLGMTDKPESTDSIGNIINHVNTLLESINLSLAGSEDLPLGKILSDVSKTVEDVTGIVGELTELLAPVLANVEKLSDQIASPEGTIMSLLNAEGPVFTSIADVLDSVTGSVSSIEKSIEFVPSQLPQIAILLSNVQSALVEAEKLIVALNNNPLLRGGVPQLNESGPGAGTPRNLDF
ncbi:MAG: MlaD family protein [Treponema sp.]|jgi:phospholipid/cholesterol/gamma-HCH transport system substrate-binding protein|nr:MlaD family protein [Treponema sp.]